MNMRDVQTGCSGYVQKNTGDENMYVSSNNLVSVYETGFVFRSPMAWGKKLLLSLAVFAIMLLKRLPDGSKQKRWLPGWVESLRILAALLLQRLRYSLYITKPKPPRTCLVTVKPARCTNLVNVWSKHASSPALTRDSVQPRLCSRALSVDFIYIGAITEPAVTIDAVAINTISVSKTINATEDKCSIFILTEPFDQFGLQSCIRAN